MMSGLSWHWDNEPRWDADKQRILGGAPDGVFDMKHTPGERLSGDWWYVRDGEQTVGYGWLDIAWGDAELLLAVDPAAQRRGVGGFILSNIEQEAAKRGLNYIHNTIRVTHPKQQELRDWLESHGFRGAETGESLRKRVSTAVATPSSEPPPVFNDKVDMQPGHEESGGYVNPEEHRY